MCKYSNEQLEEILNNINCKVYENTDVRPEIIPSEDARVIISVPIKNGADRDVYEKNNNAWREALRVGSRVSVNADQFVEIVNVEMKFHPQYQDGQCVEITGDSENPIGYTVNGGNEARGIASWAVSQVMLTHCVNI